MRDLLECYTLCVYSISHQSNKEEEVDLDRARSGPGFRWNLRRPMADGSIHLCCASSFDE